MAVTTTYKNTILDALLRNGTITGPVTVYVALSTTAIDETGAITEVSTSGTGYARQSVTFDLASAGSSLSNSTVTFPSPTTDWGTITSAALYTAATGGTMMFFSSFGPAPADIGDVIVIDAADVIISL